ncbi:MAG: hypothetical protein EPO50_07840 [Reyranella sp.]|nr:MAG: hypothetical protein EPO50_07840 [Reyranella sp.]
MGRHDGVLCRIDRAHRGLRGRRQTAGGTGPHRACGRSAAEDGGPRLSCLARNAGAAGRGRKLKDRRCGTGLPAVRSPLWKAGARSRPIRRAAERPMTK